ncbi:VOC family protein [Roseovarius sp. S1116L3]|uniref:VOC family protein n=1 Tax=Roseovarius roseus TaxID=3342636 RepID=UPI0037295260
MNAAFGLDHPLIAVRDIDALRARLISIGFNMTPVGRHPWGTSTSLAMFSGCLLEIMGIHDAALIDEIPAGDFRFGRHIHAHLQGREGIALTALHSTDAASEAAYAAKAGFDVAGQLEFGRDVTLPDGRAGRTRTTLALMPDRKWPRMSFFLCQQHRPDLIYVPAWQDHPNSVCGYAGVTVLARPGDIAPLAAKLSGLYGAVQECDGGAVLRTANGVIRILARDAVEARYGPVSPELASADQPGIVALDLTYQNAARLEACLKNGDLPYLRDGQTYRLTDPSLTGNTFLSFELIPPERA